MKLSLLLTTINRPTLQRTLESLITQPWAQGDEVLVISDDQHQALATKVQELGFPFRHIPINDGPHKDWGHTPRNRSMKLAKGDFLCHFDDDDVAVPDMLERIRHHLVAKSVNMFRFIDFKSGRRVWRQHGVLSRRYVSTQNIVHPNDPRTFGIWAPIYGGDAQFIQQTAARVRRVSWHDVVTCIYRPAPELSVAEIFQKITP